MNFRWFCFGFGYSLDFVQEGKDAFVGMLLFLCFEFDIRACSPKTPEEVRMGRLVCPD